MDCAIHTERRGRTSLNEAFVVQILDEQNATWQGTVSWARNGRTEPFRSALELLRLIDSTLKPEPSESED